MGEILIGTAGWSYDDWQDVVYPSGAGGKFDRLAYMAHLCDTIEINSSFYHIPSRRVVQSWLGRVSDLPKFQFSAKLYQEITHQRDPRTADDLLKQYVESIEPIHLAGRLGAVLLQFPWSFKFSDTSLKWLERVVGRLALMPLAIEVRHNSWLEDEFFDFLKTHHVAFCNIDQPSLKNNILPTEIATASWAYVRFHGRNAAKWFTENEEVSDRYNYFYQNDELDEWVGRIRRMAQNVERIYVYMNNHVGGQGLANAIELKSMLTGQKIASPRQLMLKFPALKDCAFALDENEVAPASRKKKTSKKTPKNEPPEHLLF
jgi:uncharacterized protein YecE (DUF72 family)